MVGSAITANDSSSGIQAHTHTACLQSLHKIQKDIHKHL